LLIVALLTLACGSGRPSTPIETPAQTMPTLQPTEVPPPTQDELAAIKFRTENSLQSDLDHVRAVALDPSAGKEFGVPLLPAEFEELMSRSANVDDIIPIIQAEAATAPNDYCGVFIDNANEGALTSGWKNNLLIHELAIRSRIQPAARLAFISCRYSKVEVDRVCDALSQADHDWMEVIPAQIQGYGCGNMHFRVEMNISSNAPDAPARVLQHYTDLLNLPPDILFVESDGSGTSLVPWGSVRVFVTRPNGKPVGDSTLSLSWESDRAGLACGIMDMGFGVPNDGKPAELPCQEGRWTIKIVESLDDVYGEGTVVVRAGKPTDLHITLDREPPAFE
jgi:hypothetical protein